MQRLNGRVQKLMTPFLVTKGSKQSTSCKLHTDMFLEHLDRMELWALKSELSCNIHIIEFFIIVFFQIFFVSVMDASAKIPSGILSGNINQLGDFDECLSIDAPNDAFQGQYCLAYIQPSVSEKYERLNYILKLVQSHNLFKSNFEDVSMTRLIT